ERFDEPRAVGAVAQRPAQTLDRRVQAVFEVDKGSLRPQLLTELVAGQHVAGTFEQHGQHLERLVLQAEPHAVLSELTRADVELESSEAEGAVGLSGRPHGASSESINSTLNQ